MEISHVLKTKLTIYDTLFGAYLKDITDSNENMNMEIPPKRIPQLMLPIENKIWKKIMIT
jgi:hypothetical protein